MKKGYFAKVSLGSLLCLLAVVAGCHISIGGCDMPAKYERKVQLSAPLAPGSVFAAETHNGSITVTGADVADCNLTATIVARAGTEQDAKKLAEEVKIKLEPSGDKLRVKIQKPAFMSGKSVGISLDVTVPGQTSPELTTHNGAIKIANIAGNTRATTHNGSVTAEQVSGSTELETHNGKISCREIAGDVRLRTHNGSVNVVYSRAAGAVSSVDIVTHNGGIELVTPPNFSASVELATHNGSITTELPITVIGKVSKRKLSGTIGTGEGKLRLETHNGSIKIR